MRIRDLGSQLPYRLDGPAWRAPLPDVTEISPGWRRHDRTHLEINLDHPADGRQWIWEAWIFLPQSFRLHPDSYTERRICSDFHSQIRFSVPHLELDEMPHAVTTLAESMGTEAPFDPSGELKLFASRAREAIARSTFKVRMMESSDDAFAQMDALSDAITAGLSDLRRKLLPAAEQIDEVTAQTARWTDEHLSRVFEASMVKLATDLEGRDPEPTVRRKVMEAAISEAQYRVARRAGPVASADSTTRELERVERRQHALKRLTSSVLWLQSDVRDARRGAENTLHAIAAGIAMTFAVTAALLYGAPTDATDVWVWGGLVVLAYMGKDRIKAALQGVFSRYVDRRYPNRRWIVRDQPGERQLAIANEKVRYVDEDDLPDDIAGLRGDVHRDELRESVESESILHHQKTIVVDADAVRAVDPRYSSLTEIFRVDVSRWLANTDDATRSVTLADPMLGELFKSSLPRAYDVTIIYRLAPTDDETSWTAARVVVSRKGIRRVDQLDDVS